MSGRLRCEISLDGAELLLRIPIGLVAERLRPGLVSRVSRLQMLSPREREVFEHLLAGRVNKEIAASTNISVRTVKFHLSNVYRKLQVSGRQQAFRIYG
jgi:DNA-binding CsgD family transcriptional regulator